MRLIPAAEIQREYRVVNSKFIINIDRADDVTQAREYIASVRERYSDASHNVPAFVIGHGKTVTEHCSDDGEPNGTAGKPILSVLRSSGLGDIVVVVTRYFGGTKLGKGGLVRAYKNAAQETLKILPKAQKIKVDTLEFALDYTHFEQTRRLINSLQGTILQEEFTEKVVIRAQVPVNRTNTFALEMQSLIHGELDMAYLAENEDTVVQVTE